MKRIKYDCQISRGYFKYFNILKKSTFIPKNPKFEFFSSGDKITYLNFKSSIRKTIKQQQKL